MSSTFSGEGIFSIKFYQTLPHECSYLPNREATTLFLDPQLNPNLRVYDYLSNKGFRRSGPHLYRPRCQGCQACQSVRLPVAAFQPSRQQRKIWNRNQDLTAKEGAPRFTEEYYRLYEAYLAERHADGDMYPPSVEQFYSFLVADQPWAQMVEFRDPKARLLAVAAVDRLSEGLSAIYTFYDPREKRRSLGVYAVLWQLEAARRAGLDYVYLGYWIENAQKMKYKKNFQPLEVLIDQEWMPFSKKDK